MQSALQVVEAVRKLRRQIRSLEAGSQSIFFFTFTVVFR